MANLKYKAINIAKAESEHKANFFKTLEGFGEETPSISDIIFILEAGGLSQDDAGKMVDENGLTDTVKKIVEALGDAGFLAGVVDQAEITKAQQRAQATSQTTGEKTKA